MVDKKRQPVYIVFMLNILLFAYAISSICAASDNIVTLVEAVNKRQQSARLFVEEGQNKTVLNITKNGAASGITIASQYAENVRPCEITICFGQIDVSRATITLTPSPRHRAEQNMQVDVFSEDLDMGHKTLHFRTTAKNVQETPRMRIITPIDEEPNVIKVQCPIPAGFDGTTYSFNILMDLDKLPQLNVTLSYNCKGKPSLPLLEFQYPPAPKPTLRERIAENTSLSRLSEKDKERFLQRVVFDDECELKFKNCLPRKQSCLLHKQSTEDKLDLIETATVSFFKDK